MESRRSKLRVTASGLCMATVVLISILTGEIQPSGERTGLVGLTGQQEQGILPATLLDLNDPVPLK
ncbi:hypothetical protein [Paenibacillus pabuli]|uniref:hypothetical protein n=1 Tax=Paenibacillus pabuli TaxID=1472 RepID=UPI000AFDD1FF|nr:hypothetical protein [Paenibacillus pabuli]MEC0127282.1 hypothetical protein [Paenibacillus pabuli]